MALEGEMRRVLLELALTSSGTTTRIDASTGGGSARYRASSLPLLGERGDPVSYWSRQWERARDDDERAAVLDRARVELRSLKHSRANMTVEETRAARDRRIVRNGAGFAAREVALWARCGVRDVRRARAAAGCEEEFGRPLPEDRCELDVGERRTRVRELAHDGVTARAIATMLGASYSTVLRDLGRKAVR